MKADFGILLSQTQKNFFLTFESDKASLPAGTHQIRQNSQMEKIKNYFSKTSCILFENVVKYTGIWMKTARTLSGALFQAYLENLKGEVKDQCRISNLPKKESES